MLCVGATAALARVDSRSKTNRSSCTNTTRESTNSRVHEGGEARSVCVEGEEEGEARYTREKGEERGPILLTGDNIHTRAQADKERVLSPRPLFIPSSV